MYFLALFLRSSVVKIHINNTLKKDAFEDGKIWKDMEIRVSLWLKI